jgi:uncharacterized membrane protein YhaH (DUF805 family)
MNWFLKVLKEHYADFKGRARRKEFWMYYLVWGIIYTVLYIIFMILAFTQSSILMGLGSLLLSAFSLATIVPTLAVGVRRLHDMGKSGKMILLLLVPIANFVVLYWWIQDSVPGDNQWGPNPKENA